MEEGEIRDVNGEEMVGRDDTDVEVFEEEVGDKMVEWSDFDEDEDAVNEGDPIRSKNELKINCIKSAVSPSSSSSGCFLGTASSDAGCWSCFVGYRFPGYSRRGGKAQPFE
ncbi:uncharacterized protein [Populus alba]|uniref:uncharacterized protein isoform X2 n=1 Tax=Populus alba TaxID=43335 RepID=UPI00158868A1|nr:uncharacterized protein LOC118038480 isoform X2 [Populus alba]